MHHRQRLSQQEPSRCKDPSPDFDIQSEVHLLAAHHLPTGKLEGKADAGGEGARPEGSLKAGVEEDEGKKEQVACSQKSQTGKNPLQWTAYPSYGRKNDIRDVCSIADFIDSRFSNFDFSILDISILEFRYSTL